ncbi:hypothetical protein ABT56_01345 [Photobacterium aquae]|uniref:Gamma-glutamylcyclotransferase AIG2-like domain-containing protein n=1 Tax=Photobacterium aquae TaxID=1195763 RepID=A0A0J1HB54_9GAMM|nr:gamma-glutamylcyclotransferase family protein [Photobacterium aquae]KLV08888.1 hypothetical protein ABT56_01345 [Photobacterium aquae]
MYIFGYGSLINQYSRQMTGNTQAAIPVTVHGLERHWGKVNGSYQIAPLVARMGKGHCNGVLVEVDEAALAQFDLREKGYTRVALEPGQIETFDRAQSALNCFNRELPLWVYTKDETEPPCQHWPIMQTYVDTVLAGCLSISPIFAKTFVETTNGWHYPRENDRHQPKYGKHAGVEREHLAHIDQLLAQIPRTTARFDKG